jgi:hypothetical protein
MATRTASALVMTGDLRLSCLPVPHGAGAAPASEGGAMKHKLFAATLMGLAAFIGYLAHAGFPTIAPLTAATVQTAQARLGGCAARVAAAERGSDIPDVASSPPRESVGAGEGWLLDPRPMTGRSER